MNSTILCAFMLARSAVVQGSDPSASGCDRSQNSNPIENQEGIIPWTAILDDLARVDEEARVHFSFFKHRMLFVQRDYSPMTTAEAVYFAVPGSERMSQVEELTKADFSSEDLLTVAAHLQIMLRSAHAAGVGLELRGLGDEETMSQIKRERSMRYYERLRILQGRKAPDDGEKWLVEDSVVSQGVYVYVPCPESREGTISMSNGAGPKRYSLGSMRHSAAEEGVFEQVRTEGRSVLCAVSVEEYRRVTREFPLCEAYVPMAVKVFIVEPKMKTGQDPSEAGKNGQGPQISTSQGKLVFSRIGQFRFRVDQIAVRKEMKTYSEFQNQVERYRWAMSSAVRAVSSAVSDRASALRDRVVGMTASLGILEKRAATDRVGDWLDPLIDRLDENLLQLDETGLQLNEKGLQLDGKGLKLDDRNESHEDDYLSRAWKRARVFASSTKGHQEQSEGQEKEQSEGQEVVSPVFRSFGVAADVDSFEDLMARIGFVERTPSLSIVQDERRSSESSNMEDQKSLAGIDQALAGIDQDIEEDATDQFAVMELMSGERVRFSSVIAAVDEIPDEWGHCPDSHIPRTAQKIDITKIDVDGKHSPLTFELVAAASDHTADHTSVPGSSADRVSVATLMNTQTVLAKVARIVADAVLQANAVDVKKVSYSRRHQSFE